VTDTNHKQGADDKLVLALAGGATLAAAAAQAGVSERTAHRRKACGEFQARLQDLRGQLLEQAATKLLAGMTRAAERLAELVESEDDRTALAARAVLSLGLLARERLDHEALTRELQERLGQIEAGQQGGQPQW
jgi:hypothetical protein